MNATSTREQLQRAIFRIAKRTGNGQSSPDVTGIALRLSSKYPQSGLTIDEICAEITSRLQKDPDQSERRD